MFLVELNIMRKTFRVNELLNTCSKCNQKKSRNGRYCHICHAEYLREWRKIHPLNDEQKFKNNVRRKTNMRIKRGLLIPYPCEVCSEVKVQAHHDDYNKPYEIRWLCIKHHMEYHKILKIKDK